MRVFYDDDVVATVISSMLDFEGDETECPEEAVVLILECRSGGFLWLDLTEAEFLTKDEANKQLH